MQVRTINLALLMLLVSSSWTLLSLNIVSHIDDTSLIVVSPIVTFGNEIFLLFHSSRSSISLLLKVCLQGRTPVPSSTRICFIIRISGRKIQGCSYLRQLQTQTHQTTESDPICSRAKLTSLGRNCVFNFVGKSLMRRPEKTMCKEGKIELCYARVGCTVTHRRVFLFRLQLGYVEAQFLPVGLDSVVQRYLVRLKLAMLKELKVGLELKIWNWNNNVDIDRLHRVSLFSYRWYLRLIDSCPFKIVVVVVVVISSAGALISKQLLLHKIHKIKHHGGSLTI